MNYEGRPIWVLETKCPKCNRKNVIFDVTSGEHQDTVCKCGYEYNTKDDPTAFFDGDSFIEGPSPR